LTEAELVARCLAREPAAERELYDRHVDRMYRLAFRFSGDPDVASDYVQEGFIRAFERLRQFRGQSALSTWLASIIVSIALNDARRMRRRWHQVSIDDSVPAPAAAQATPDLRQRLSDAVRELSPKLLPVFLMHDVEGYTHEEIGKALGIPTGTSKARLSDARARLRVALARFAGEITT
jgi:RNA polymerase sigma-70 factor (ECF subfamily)